MSIGTLGAVVVLSASFVLGSAALVEMKLAVALSLSCKFECDLFVVEDRLEDS